VWRVVGWLGGEREGRGDFLVGGGSEWHGESR
jgi:hypothetical protein